jgi:hypothetical protein
MAAEWMTSAQTMSLLAGRKDILFANHAQYEHWDAHTWVGKRERFESGRPSCDRHCLIAHAPQRHARRDMWHHPNMQQSVEQA